MQTEQSQKLSLMQARDTLGCQLWLERTDSPERIDYLCAQAAEAGCGWLRLFLMWPWIEEQPGNWDFAVFDAAFEAAARHNLKIKATLTANSGPWHIGTPSVLHSHTGFLAPEQREPMRHYIQRCVERYREHPALGQWILWNEPQGGRERTPETLVHWQEWLRQRYSTPAELNQRWRTGYQDFAEIPFPEDIPQPEHKWMSWNSYGPWLEDWQCRAAWLNEEIDWVGQIVRAIDPHTPTCVNPSELFGNHAAGGLNLHTMGKVVNVIGASYHPVWHFDFAWRESYPALMAAGIRMQATVPAVQTVEVTEVQVGNTVNSSTRPNNVTPDEIARFFLASLAAGADSVTGWCLNTRSQDFESGDWGLLDDMDQPSERSRMLRRVHDRLNTVYAQTGAWQAMPARAFVAYDPRAQALEWIESHMTPPIAGRMVNDGLQGEVLLTTRLMHNGLATDLVHIEQLPAEPTTPGDLLVLSHLSWDEATAARILHFVENGGTLLLDATSGRRDLDARLHRPWPGGLVEAIGLRATGLDTNPAGHALLWHKQAAGHAPLVRLCATLDQEAQWSAWDDLRFASDGSPCVWERSYGRGRIVVARIMLGAALLHAPATRTAITELLRRCSPAANETLVPIGHDQDIYAIPVKVEHGTLTVVLAPDSQQRQGLPIYLRARQKQYHDFWTGAELHSSAEGELTLTMPEGIAMLYTRA